METQRAVLVVFLIFFFLFSPETAQPSRAQRKRLSSRISKEHQALERLRNSSYGDVPLRYHEIRNETGVGDEDKVSWHLLPEVQKRARAQYLELLLDTKNVSTHDVVAGSEQSFEFATESPLPVYQNVTGTIHGAFLTRSLAEEIQTPVNLTLITADNKYSVQDFWKNVTETEGVLSLDLFEEANGGGADDTVREISADVAVQTESSPGSGWEMKLFGVHYPMTGSIILTTTSEKFPGIFTLPHFALTRAGFHQSKELLNHSLSETFLHQEQGSADDFVSPWSAGSGSASATMFSVPTCEYIVYLQQQPVHFPDLSMNSKQLLRLVKQVEQELQFPEGAPIPSVPPMIFSAVVFSPDCGFILESGRGPDLMKSHFLSGPKIEIFWILIRQLLLALVIVLGLQISLLKRQMDEASTPSMRSRTSYHSIAIMAMGDGLMLASLVTFSMVNDAGFLILTSAGFLCFFNFAFFEMKFIYDIWLVQVGDQRRRDNGRRDHRQDGEVQDGTMTQLSRHGRLQPSNPASDDSSSLPLPVTAPRSDDTEATPIILPSDQDMGNIEENEQQNAAAPGPSPAVRSSLDFQTLYSRFYFSMLVLVFFSLWAVSWPKALRSAYINSLCFAYLSFWIPQIYRNIMRNCRQAFTWEYVIGISILRVLPVLYCYVKKSNTLRIDTDPFAAAVLACWVSMQILALAAQEFLGPRLFVKESWCPPAYDYHPLLQNDVGDVESGSLLPIGFVASASEAKDKDHTKRKDSRKNLKIFDCAICMNEIEVPVVPSKETVDKSGLGAGWISRRAYMVTPCRHIFHSECLEGWMRLRLVCPICRESLPPL